MAKKSMVERDLKRKRIVAKYAEKRAALKKIIADPNITTSSTAYNGILLDGVNGVHLTKIHIKGLVGDYFRTLPRIPAATRDTTPPAPNKPTAKVCSAT